MMVGERRAARGDAVGAEEKQPQPQGGEWKANPTKKGDRKKEEKIRGPRG